MPIALPEEFLAASVQLNLPDRYGLSADAIVARVKGELGGSAQRAWRTDPAPGHGVIGRGDRWP